MNGGVPRRILRIMPEYYPVNLNLERQKCIVIGGGRIAERKARRLLSCGAQVLLISPRFTAALPALAKKNKRIVCRKRAARLEDVRGAFLVICASDDRTVNSMFSRHCRNKGLLVNVADSPAECGFILPAVVARGALRLSVSTEGLSPGLSKKIGRDLRDRFGSEYAAFLRLMGTLRPIAIRTLTDPKKRRAFFEGTLEPEVFSLLRRNKIKQAKEKLERLLNNV